MRNPPKNSGEATHNEAFDFRGADNQTHPSLSTANIALNYAIHHLLIFLLPKAAFRVDPSSELPKNDLNTN